MQFCNLKMSLFVAIPIGTARVDWRPATRNDPQTRLHPQTPYTKKKRSLRYASGKKTFQGPIGLWHKLSFSSLLPAKVAGTILLARWSSTWAPPPFTPAVRDGKCAKISPSAWVSAIVLGRGGPRDAGHLYLSIYLSVYLSIYLCVCVNFNYYDTTLRCITLQYITLHCIALHCTALRCVTFDYITLRYILTHTIIYYTP